MCLIACERLLCWNVFLKKKFKKNGSTSKSGHPLFSRHFIIHFFCRYKFQISFFLSFVNKNAIFLHLSILSGAQWANTWITSPPTSSAANGHVNVSATANQLDAEENIPGSTTLAVLNYNQSEIKYRIKVYGNDGSFKTMQVLLMTTQHYSVVAQVSFDWVPRIITERWISFRSKHSITKVVTLIRTCALLFYQNLSYRSKNSNST